MSQVKRALEDEIEDIREELGDDCTVDRLLMELAAVRLTHVLPGTPDPDSAIEESDEGCPICKRPLLRLKAGIIADDPHDTTRRTMDPAAIAAMDRFIEQHGDRLSAPAPVTFVRARYAEPPTGETGPEYAASVAAGFVEDKEE
jgi:hypothetical protein